MLAFYPHCCRKCKRLGAPRALGTLTRTTRTAPRRTPSSRPPSLPAPPVHPVFTATLPSRRHHPRLVLTALAATKAATIFQHRTRAATQTRGISRPTLSSRPLPSRHHHPHRTATQFMLAATPHSPCQPRHTSSRPPSHNRSPTTPHCATPHPRGRLPCSRDNYPCRTAPHPRRTTNSRPPPLATTTNSATNLPGCQRLGGLNLRKAPNARTAPYAAHGHHPLPPSATAPPSATNLPGCQRRRGLYPPRRTAWPFRIAARPLGNLKKNPTPEGLLGNKFAKLPERSLAVVGRLSLSQRRPVHSARCISSSAYWKNHSTALSNIQNIP